MKGSRKADNTEVNIKNIPTSPNKVITQATQEVQSRVNRRNNILIFNVPESESNLKEQVEKEDTKMFNDMCDCIEAGVHETDIVNIKRIGKKNQTRVKGEREDNISSIALLTLTEICKRRVMSEKRT